MMKRFLPVLLLLLLAVQVASAQEGPTQDEVNAVARKLFCPVCENTPLDVCPTEACQQWRDVIRTKLMEGQSEEEILDYFATMYGDSVLAQPPPRQVVAWLLPIVIVVAAVAALAYWLRSWTRPESVPVAVTPEEVVLETDPYVERLERELSEWA
jgi:cytochrome c-type biogenesis protein CcmH